MEDSHSEAVPVTGPSSLAREVTVKETPKPGVPRGPASILPPSQAWPPGVAADRVDHGFTSEPGPRREPAPAKKALSPLGRVQGPAEIGMSQRREQTWNLKRPLLSTNAGQGFSKWSSLSRVRGKANPQVVGGG